MFNATDGSAPLYTLIDSIFCSSSHGRLVINTGEYYAELVSADSRKEVHLPEALGDDLRRGYQKVVARLVPECIVHDLQPVDIYENDADGRRSSEILARCAICSEK